MVLNTNNYSSNIGSLNTNIIEDFIISFLTISFSLYIFLIFFTVSIIYLTYRFWKFLLPKSSTDIYILNDYKYLQYLKQESYKINEKIIDSDFQKNSDINLKPLKVIEKNNIKKLIFIYRTFLLFAIPLVSIFLTLVIHNYLK